MKTMVAPNRSADASGRNRRLGFALAAVTLLYVVAVITFIVAY